MKKNLPKLSFVLGVIILVYFLKTYFVEYNLSKSISACIVAQKQTSKSFDLKKAKKECEEKIRK